ncbi:MAG: glutamyl-tRNA reductase [Crocinitomicaceae bacterium]
MKRFNVIAFTHHTIGVEEIGKFHLEDHQMQSKLQHLKDQLNLDELMYVSTCNRVEFIFLSSQELDNAVLTHFLNEFNEEWDQEHLSVLVENCKSWNGINAVNHLIEVASSLDSMVIGEREIITQMKDAYELSRKYKLSGDTIRIVMRQVIQTAKKVYTQTNIAAKPVSVVSLAYHQLVKRKLSENARVVFIGAGVTNTNMGRFLLDHGYSNFTVFNRSLENAALLAELVKGKARKLADIKDYKEGFDLLVCCTASKNSVIDTDIYKNLLAGEEGEKIVIDLAVPQDLDKQVKEQFKVDHISVEFLKTISENNLKERKRELIKVRQIIYEAVEEFKQIFKMRQVELKMQAIPQKVKEIKKKAVEEVFSKDLAQLDDESREVVDRILDYMEKKYVSVPMLMAKKMIANNEIPSHED